jgi:hypothetical protein
MEKRPESPSDLPTAPSNTRRLLEARSKFRAPALPKPPRPDEKQMRKNRWGNFAHLLLREEFRKCPKPEGGNFGHLRRFPSSVHPEPRMLTLNPPNICTS